MAALISACKVVDGVERSTSVDDIARNYRHLENCDPQNDMLFAEVNGQLIAYGRIWWDDLLDGNRLYHPFGFLHPAWRGKGIGNALWEAAELRAREITTGHPQEKPKFLQVEAFESEKALVALLKSRGYRPVRYETSMVRDLGEPFPSAPMPAELEVRPVKSEHLRHIFEASNEAFRDHWGIRDMSEEDNKSEMESPNFKPELWKVAWDGDQMASVVHNFVDEKENAGIPAQTRLYRGHLHPTPLAKKGTGAFTAGAEHADVQGDGHDRNRPDGGLGKPIRRISSLRRRWLPQGEAADMLPQADGVK